MENFNLNAQNNSRQNVANMSANIIFPAVQPIMAMGQCYPQAYYNMPQLPTQQQTQIGFGYAVTGFNTVMALQPVGYISGPVTMPFYLNPGNPVLNVNNIHSFSYVGLPSLPQTPFCFLTGMLCNTNVSAASSSTNNLPHRYKDPIQSGKKLGPHALEVINPLTKENILINLKKEVMTAKENCNEKEKGMTTNNDVKLNETNTVDHTLAEDDVEVLSQPNIENDNCKKAKNFRDNTNVLTIDGGETLTEMHSPNDETNTQITYSNKTLTKLIACEEKQETPPSPTNTLQYTRKELMNLRQSTKSTMQPDIKNTCVFDPYKLGNIIPFRNQHNVKQNSANLRSKVTCASALPNVQNKSTPKKPIIYLNLSLNNDVQLNKAEKAWCPTGLRKASDNLDKNPELKKQEEKNELLRRVRGILNKLTPEKFEPLVKEIIKLKIDTLDKIESVMTLVFEKAIDETNFSASYAKLCHRLINEGKKGDEHLQSSTKSNLAHFHTALLNKLESEFNNYITNINAKEEKLKPIREKLLKCQDKNDKIELEALLIEEERKIRRRSGGTVRFIGELFKISLLSGRIINCCIEALLKESSNEDMLEYLCKLLTTVGQKFEQTPTCQEGNRKYSLKSVVQRMQIIASKTGNTKISSRIRFMLLDVIDLRKKKWQTIRNEGPKTMEQIEKEVNTVQGCNNTKNVNKDEIESQKKRFKRINDRIQQMLNEGKTSDHIIHFIHGNIQVVNQAFIHILTNTLTNFAIKNLNIYTLDVHCFRYICIPVLRRYLDSKDDLKMECLCAIQMLIHDLDHPKDLLQKIFYELSDAHIIAQETFLLWKAKKNLCKKCSIENL